MSVIRVVGLGNEDAGDDAAGVLAVRAARELTPGESGIEFRESVPGSSLIDVLDGASDVVLVDAVRDRDGGGHPGRLVRVELERGTDLAGFAPNLSSHGLGVAESVALARALGRRPRIVFLGVHASRLSVGDGMSLPVRAALPRLVSMIRLEIERAAGRRLGHPAGTRRDPT